MTLAYAPFIDPINFHDWWFTLLAPISLGISIAYKAVRVPDLRSYWRQVVVLTVQIVLSMIGLGIGAYLFVVHIVPLIAPR